MPPSIICRTATTFTSDGALDLAAQEEFLARMVDSGIGIYLASAGAGEGHALRRDEVRELYLLGVSAGHGRVPVGANPPEAHTARAAIEHLQLAVTCGVDVVNVYGPAGWHGYHPTDEEYASFYDDVFREVSHPTALSPNPAIGYAPSAAVVARICAKYHQVVAVNLGGLDDAYFRALQAALTRPVDLYMPFDGSLESLHAGAAGILGAAANILPRTVRDYVDRFAVNDMAGLDYSYSDLRRFGRYVKGLRGTSARWIKMCMAVLDLPGGAGGLRVPYRMSPAKELGRFAAGLRSLDIAEIAEAGR